MTKPVFLLCLLSILITVEEVQSQNQYNQPRPGGFNLGGTNSDGSPQKPRPGAMLLGTAKPVPPPTLIPKDPTEMRKKMSDLIDERRRINVNTLSVEQRLNEVEFETHLKEWQLLYWQSDIEWYKTFADLVKHDLEFQNRKLKELNADMEHLKERLQQMHNADKSPDRHANVPKSSVLVPREYTK